jgi:hypothetical protein
MNKQPLDAQVRPHEAGTASGDPVIVEVTIAAPADTVWRALREPEEIRRWHGWEYDGLDDEIRAIYVDGATASEQDLTLDVGAGCFALEPHGETTVLRITRPAPVGKTTWDGIYDEVNEGWIAFAHQLRYYLERHHGQPRHTIVLDSPATLPQGEEWFRTERQHATLLGDYGLATTPDNKTVVSTYGLDAAALAQLTARLTN